VPRDRTPARWQDPGLDEQALAVAAGVRGALAALGDGGDDRWIAWFEPLLGVFEDGDAAALRTATRRARAAFGAKDSVMDAWPDEAAALRLRDAIDRLQRALDQRAARLR